MSTESIKTKTKDNFVRVSQEDKKELGPRSKDGLHKLIVKSKVQDAQIKGLETKYAQSEAKVAQLSLQIENSKLGVQPKPEDLTFDCSIVQEFCNFPVPDPRLKAPLNYICSNKNPPLDPLSGRILTTTFCKLCDATRESFLNAASDASMYERAVKKEGRKNIPLIVALHGQLQTITQERDDYREFKESHRERTAEAFAQYDQKVRLLENKMEEQGRVHRTKEYEQRAQIEKQKAQNEKLESENNDLKNQMKTMESRLSEMNKEMNNHDAEFETLRLESAKLKETIGIKEEVDYTKTCLKETQEQMTQAQFRLSEITDLTTTVQAIQKHPDWAMRFQTIDEIDELRKKFETAENTVTSLKIQQENNNQAINTLEARNEALSTVEKTLECDLTSLKREMLLANGIIIDVNKYFTNKQSWESRKHVDMPDNYDELAEAIRLKTEIRQKVASFIQQTQGKKQP
jgi:DNA repair exonuclease SbcCD ATPase subunit